MEEKIRTVGVREFREELAQYLTSPKPVAVTRHGRTVGYYIPAPQVADEVEVAALRRAAAEMEALLAELGVDEEQVVRDLRAARKTD